MFMKKEKVQEDLKRLLSMFESGDLPQAVARTTIRRRGGHIPSDRWSLGNRLIMLTHGTSDAWGFNQWREVKRCVKKGARAFYIFGPCKKKVVEKSLIRKPTKKRK